MIVAGEASGDHHAAKVAEALVERRPEITLFGMGGPEMRKAGVELLVDSSDIAVVGLIEVLKHYPEIKAVLRKLENALYSRRPGVLVLVDYPEFNLKLARTAKAAGIKVLFYVSPQVWAWRAGRVPKIGKVIDMMAVVFPFETELYERHGIPVRFVGHPLLDDAGPTQPASQSRIELGLDPARKTVGLFPGSRHGELKRLMPLLVDVGRELKRKFPDLQLVVPIAPTLKHEDVSQYLDEQSPEMILTRNNIYDVIASCDAIAAASGTATLQIALCGVPMAVVYRIAGLTYAIARRLVKSRYIALANVIADETVVREFVQHEAEPRAVSAEIRRLLTDTTYADTMRTKLLAVKTSLGEAGGSARTAELALDLLNE